jgi:hypothetical protein
MDIKKVIIDEIKRTPVSRYRLSKETGVDEALLSRLVRGKAGLSLENAEKLLDYFDLIEIKKPAKSSGREMKHSQKHDELHPNRISCPAKKRV